MDPNEIDRRLARLFIPGRYVVTVERHGQTDSCSSYSDLKTATTDYKQRLLDAADLDDITLTDQHTGEQLRRSFAIASERGVMETVKIPQLLCLRCGWTWVPRVVKVWQCPRCKSPQWNVPRDKETRS